MVTQIRTLKLKPALKQSIIYGISLVSSKSVSLLLLPIVTHFLTPRQYGQLAVLTTIETLSGIFFGFGLAITFYRFIANASSLSEQKKICANVLGLALVSSLVFGLILYLLLPFIRRLMQDQVTLKQLYWVTLALLPACLSSLQLAWLRLKNRAITYLSLNLGLTVIQAILTIGVLIMHYGVIGVLAASALSNLSLGLIQIIMQSRETGLTFDWQQSKQFIQYGWPLILSSLAAFCYAGFGSGLDQLWLANTKGLTITAEYALAVKFTAVVSFLITPFALWWDPRRFVILKHDDGLQRVAKIISIGTSLCFLAALCVGLVGIIVIQLLTPASYHLASQYLPWLVLITAISEAISFLNLGCHLNHTYYPMIINVVCVPIAIVLYSLLVPNFGVYGLIGTKYLIAFVRLSVFVYVSQKTIRIPYPAKKLIIVGLMTIGALILGVQTVQLFWQMMTAIALMIILWYFTTKLGLLPAIGEVIRR